MANSEKNMAEVDAEQALRFAFDNNTKTFATGNFVGLKIGHKIEQVAVNSSTDDFKYYDGATLLQTIRVTYTTSTKDVLSSVERIA